MAVNDIADETRTLGLLLIDGFALMSYASVIEPYRAANVLAGRALYRWVHISPDGQPARASNGATIIADRRVGEAVACDTLFVFAAGDPNRPINPAVFAWLRHAALGGTVIAGISAGPYLLARAGLLDGYRATVHWEHRPAFVEAFPQVTPDPGLYVIDRRRVTCAGGIAGLDLAVDLIEREQGHALAAQIGDWFLQREPREADAPQRLTLRARYAIADDRVLRVLAAMEASVEDPVSPAALAQIAGTSVRQLERLFARLTGETLGRHYVRIRLTSARQLLRTTRMPITSVGLACGFKSSSHFSRVYVARYGKPPSAERRQSAGVQ
ncbi:GlxA family transcriptional regulator [uncultured Sphingomonas sp.]|uniref:GlxA family transcriptional regulator n=1 Tax=uncultured Sphingomonas sp. TaxID=158754 RepID=UPI0035CBB17E